MPSGTTDSTEKRRVVLSMFNLVYKLKKCALMNSSPRYSSEEVIKKRYRRCRVVGKSRFCRGICLKTVHVNGSRDILLVLWGRWHIPAEY